MSEPLLPRDLAVLRHIGLYRVGLYPVLSHLFFGGSGPACGVAISPVMSWLAEIGKLLFMFFVGFEIDLELFKKTRNRSLTFGFFTFIIPLLAGILLGRECGYHACNLRLRAGPDPDRAVRLAVAGVQVPSHLGRAGGRS